MWQWAHYEGSMWLWTCYGGGDGNGVDCGTGIHRSKIHDGQCWATHRLTDTLLIFLSIDCWRNQLFFSLECCCIFIVLLWGTESSLLLPFQKWCCGWRHCCSRVARGCSESETWNSNHSRDSRTCTKVRYEICESRSSDARWSHRIAASVPPRIDAGIVITTTDELRWK